MAKRDLELPHLPMTPGGTPFLRAKELRAQGLSVEQIKHQLVEEGVDPESAMIVVGGLPDSPVPVRLGKAKGPLAPGATVLAGAIAWLVIGAGLLLAHRFDLVPAPHANTASLLGFGALAMGAVQLFRGLLSGS